MSTWQWTSSLLAFLLAASSGSTAFSATAASQALANGKAIFQTGIDLQGKHISAQPAAMMPRCAACHYADGHGGMHLPGGAVSADVRSRVLVKKEQPPYTLALLERAISTGVDNKGAHLDKVMPRWQLSKTDLHDVAAYVLTLK
jgi:mono/diheme cytochrome c family protein